MTPTPPPPMPDWIVHASDGTVRRLWDYRQRSHLVLLNDPKAEASERRRWSEAIASDRKRWDWLQVSFLVADRVPQAEAPGAYLIDRYGRLLAHYAPGQWTFDDIEREFLYHEARHC